MKRYEQKTKQYRQNRLFSVNQKRFYPEINGESRQEKIIPDAEESKRFWEGIWDEVKEHNASRMVERNQGKCNIPFAR